MEDKSEQVRRKRSERNGIDEGEETAWAQRWDVEQPHETGELQAVPCSWAQSGCEQARGGRALGAMAVG